MKTPALFLVLNLFCISSLAFPPFYYGKPVKVINIDSVYYGCTGMVADWVDGGVVVKDVCGDYVRETFKDSELMINSKGSAQKDNKF